MPDASLTHLLETWQQDLILDRASATARRYLGAIHRFLNWYENQEHRPLEVQHLTPIALVNYRTILQRTESTSTVNTHVCALRTWCGRLVAKGYLSANPAERFRLVAHQPRHAPQALRDPEVNALLRAAARSRHSARDTAIVQLLLQTGMRIGECAALRWADVTFGEKQGRILIRAGKGNKARQVPLNLSARSALAGYAAHILGCEPTLRTVAGTYPDPDSPQGCLLFWQSQKGGVLSVSAMGRMIDTLVKECASRHLVPTTASAHTLRHTFAHHYLRAHPGDLVGLAALLGHSSLNTTRIYVQPTDEEIASRVEQIGINAW